MPMTDAFKSNWRRVKGEGFMGRMLSPSDLEHYQKRRAQRLLWRNLSSGRRRLWPKRVVARGRRQALSIARERREERTECASNFCRTIEWSEVPAWKAN